MMMPRYRYDGDDDDADDEADDDNDDCPRSVLSNAADVQLQL